MRTSAERLKEERLRLGLNQTNFGAIAGVQKQAQIKYEKGERSPDADYLSAIAGVGADVLYILTGQRSVGSVPTASPLTREEEALLDNFRHCPPDARRAIKETSAAFAKYSDCCGKDQKGGKSA